MVDALFDVFADSARGSAAGAGAGEPCADFVELLTALLALCGGTSSARTAAALSLYDPNATGRLSRAEVREFIRAILLLLCIGGGLDRVAAVAEHEYGTGAPLAPWEGAAAALADQAFRDLEVVREAGAPPPPEAELEEGEVPAAAAARPCLMLRVGEFGEWFTAVVEPLLEDEEEDDVQERLRRQAPPLPMHATEAPPSLPASRVEAPAHNHPGVDVADPRVAGVDAWLTPAEAGRLLHLGVTPLGHLHRLLSLAADERGRLAPDAWDAVFARLQVRLRVSLSRPLPPTPPLAPSPSLSLDGRRGGRRRRGRRPARLRGPVLSAGPHARPARPPGALGDGWG